MKMEMMMIVVMMMIKMNVIMLMQMMVGVVMELVVVMMMKMEMVMVTVIRKLSLSTNFVPVNPLSTEDTKSKKSSFTYINSLNKNPMWVILSFPFQER